MAFDIRLQSFGSGFNIALGAPADPVSNGTATVSVPFNATGTGAVISNATATTTVPINSTSTAGVIGNSTGAVSVLFNTTGTAAVRGSATASTSVTVSTSATTEVVPFPEYAGRGLVTPIHAFATKMWQTRARVKAACVAPLIVLPNLGVQPPQPMSPRGVVRSLVPVEQFRKTFDPTARIIERNSRIAPVNTATGTTTVLVNIAGTVTALGQAVGASQVVVNTSATAQRVGSASATNTVVVNAASTAQSIASGVGSSNVLVNLAATSQAVIQGSATTNVVINTTGTGSVIGSSTAAVVVPITVAGNIGQVQDQLYAGRIVRPVPTKGPDYKRLFSQYRRQIIVPTLSVQPAQPLSPRGVVRPLVPVEQFRKSFDPVSRLISRANEVSPARNASGAVSVLSNVTGTAQGRSSATANTTVLVNATGTATGRPSATATSTVLVNATATGQVRGSATASVTVPVSVTGTASLTAQPGFTGFGIIRPATKSLAGFYGRSDSHYYGARFSLPSGVRVSSASATVTVPVNITGTATVISTQAGRSVAGTIRPLVPFTDFVNKPVIAKAQITVPTLAPAAVASLNASATVSVLANTSSTVVTNPPGSGVIITPLVSHRTFANNKRKAWAGRGATIIVAGDYPAPTRNAVASVNVLANLAGTALVTNGPIASATVTVPFNASATAVVIPNPEFTAFGITQPMVKDLGKFKRTIDEYKVRQITPSFRTAPSGASATVSVPVNITGTAVRRASATATTTVPFNVTATATARTSATATVSVLANTTATASVRANAIVPVVTVTPIVSGQVLGVGSPINGNVSVLVNATGTATSRMAATGTTTVPVNATATAVGRPSASATVSALVNVSSTAQLVGVANASVSALVEAIATALVVPTPAQGRVEVSITTAGELAVIPTSITGNVTVPFDASAGIVSQIRVDGANLTIPFNAIARASSFRLNPSGTRTITPVEAVRIVFVGEEKRTIATQMENRKVIADASSRTIG